MNCMSMKSSKRKITRKKRERATERKVAEKMNDREIERTHRKNDSER